ncbi:lipid kinase [Microlunatus flavus]|uniref:Lipid kinase, YegS/Rv2252/BmrU family n=1 Tax=Microlunatus flavus TaxID=1036181 RepID=A0A1H9J3B3_9ACTN|nr:lipid kinase [Microlunatus flavus]SEQ81323.1 lipid kinase, YegS/Rv2252/BmrU family [Microlunatus flavus]
MTPTTEQAALVVNSGSRRGAAAFEDAHRMLLERGVDVVEAFGVSDPARLRETVEQAVERGRRLIVVGGGDGTFSSVVDVLAGTDVTLGVLPLGTANDLARTLELPLDLAAACDTVANGKVVDIDVGRIGGTAFLNVASSGLSVEVAQAMSPVLKRRLGPLAYPIAAVPAYRRHTPFTAELTFPLGDHEPVRLEGLLQLAVGNGRFYGGGNAVSQVAGIDDHQLDVYAIPAGRFREHVNIARFFRSGTFVEHPEVLHLRTRAVDLATDHPVRVNVDGEVVATTPVSFTVSPNALDVIVPQHSRAARRDRPGPAGRD